MIKVSNLQRGNKLLEFLSAAAWHYDGSLTSDYEIGQFIRILFLSLKFHAAKPEYIHKRIKKMKESKLQILLILVDTPNYNTILEELFRTINIKIILCKNYDECSRYLKGFDICSRRTSDILRKKESTLDNFIESFPKINKNNSVILQSAFTNLQDMFGTDENDLSRLFGMSKEKATLFHSYLNKSFK